MTNGALFRVSLAGAGPGRFALVVEANHTLVDGHTFYKVYGMLQPGAKVVALNPERKRCFTEAAAGFRGGYDAIFNPCCRAFDRTGTGFVLTNLRSAPAEPHVLDVDVEWVREQKAASPGCSTNDVISSALLRVSGAKYGVVIVNMRHRIAQVEEDDAGNYWRPQEVLEHEFCTPMGVRHIVDASVGGAAVRSG